MIEPKVRLSLVVPGATMLSRQECLKNPKESYNTHRILLETEEGKGKKRVKELITVKTRKSKPATQSLSICKEAYDYMVNPDIAPLPYNEKDKKGKTLWASMSIEERLKFHMEEIAKGLGASEYSYEILDD